MKHWKYAALLLCVASLVACRTTQAIQDDLGDLPSASFSMPKDQSAALIGNCPVVEVVQDLAVYSDFVPPSEMSQSNLVSSVGMQRMATNCNDNKRSVTVDVQLAFDAVIGPHGRVNSGDKPYFTYPYFVAVTDPSGKIMAKEIFAASFAFEPGEEHHTHQETLRQIIPLDNPAGVTAYHVLIGFQLSQDQLAYNRAAIQKAKAQAVSAERAAIAQKVQMQGAAPPPPAAAPAPVERAPLELAPH